MDWYWLLAMAVGGWILVSIALAVAFSRFIAAMMNGGHDAVIREREVGGRTPVARQL
jgi:hypothetical protein